MNKTITWAAPVVLVLLVASFLVYKHFYGDKPAAPKPVAVVEAPAVAPEDHFPVAPTADASGSPPLPDLNNSDAMAGDALGGLLGNDTFTQWLVPGDLIRHFVVSIDNLPRKKLALNLRPIKPVGGALITSGVDESLTLSSENYVRYQPLVKVVQLLDTQKVGALYRRFYPLFQKAYQDLGYPNAYFNDRVVQVIDDLLATPDVSAPIKLVQPSVMYQYADPKIEALSAGQKTLIRMGPENAAIVKGKLREWRTEVIRKQ